MTLKEQFEKETGITLNCHSDIVTYKLYSEWLEKCVPQWVSVYNKLPSMYSHVVVTDGREVARTFISYRSSAHVKDNSRVFHICNMSNDSWLGKITHWIDLPLPIVERGTDAEP